MKVPATSHRFYGNANYTFVGIITEPSPTIVFAYSTDFFIVNKTTSSYLTLLFLTIAYGGLAWITYDKKDMEMMRRNFLARLRVEPDPYLRGRIRRSQHVAGTGSAFYLHRRWSPVPALATHWRAVEYFRTAAHPYRHQRGGRGRQGRRNDQDQSVGYDRAISDRLVWLNPDDAYHNHATLAKLLLTDSRLDVYKFQMAIFTVVVAFYVIWAGQTDSSQVRKSPKRCFI